MIHDDRWLETLSAHVDRELSAEEELKAQRHLAECIECRRTVAGMRNVVSAAAAAPRAVSTSPDWARLAMRLREPRAGRRTMSPMVALAASIALLIAVGGGAWLFDDTRRPNPDSPPSATASLDQLIVEIDNWARLHPNDPLAAELLGVAASTRSHRDRRLMLSTLIP
jgi:anti-sigma factor RsiW